MNEEMQKFLRIEHANLNKLFSDIKKKRQVLKECLSSLNVAMLLVKTF